MTIIPIHPDDVEGGPSRPQDRAAPARQSVRTRRTFGFRGPSRRTFARRGPSRRTFARARF